MHPVFQVEPDQDDAEVSECKATFQDHQAFETLPAQSSLVASLH